jgi:hypothetical protein
MEEKVKAEIAAIDLTATEEPAVHTSRRSSSSTGSASTTGQSLRSKDKMPMPAIDSTLVGFEIEYKFSNRWVLGEALRVSDGTDTHVFSAGAVLSGPVPKGWAEVDFDDGERDWVALRGVEVVKGTHQSSTTTPAGHLLVHGGLLQSPNRRK